MRRLERADDVELAARAAAPPPSACAAIRRLFDLLSAPSSQPRRLKAPARGADDKGDPSPPALRAP